VRSFGPTSFAGALEKQFDALGSFGMVVEGEVQLRRPAKSQTVGQFVTEIGPCMVESFQSLLRLNVAGFDADFHMGVAHVGRDVDFGDHHIAKARVFQFKSDDFR
jgi:hypothetical protein